jgi:hypothetical protein
MTAKHDPPWLWFSQECSPSGGNCGLIFLNRVGESEFRDIGHNGI